MPDAVREHWHMSKNVPIAIVVALLLQTGAWIWSAAQTSAQVNKNTEGVAENKLELKENGSVEPRLVRVETDISYIRRAVDDNKIKLEKLDDKLTELLRETRSPR